MRFVDDPEAAVLAAAKDMLRRGLVEGTAGNISARREDGNLVITPSSVDYAEMALDDLVLVDPDGAVLAAKDGRSPSSEMKLHLACFQAFDDIGSVIHSHPVWATMFAIAHQSIPACIDEFAVYCGGGNSRAGYAATRTAHHLDNADLLVPDFFNPDTDQWHIAIQSWVIEVDGLTVVVDTGVGNDRQRPHMPPLHNLNTGFLAALQSAGIDRNAVDVVINTHIHSDHVGWNTMRDKDSWVPTFPNARYLVPAADYHHFEPDGPAARQSPRTEAEAAEQRGNQLVFADSVLPVDEAGQLIQWSDDYQISQSLRLRPAPGHTPGSSVLLLDAGEPAVFVGDLTHSPLQLCRPADPCAFDMEAGAAAANRRPI